MEAPDPSVRRIAILAMDSTSDVIKTLSRLLEGENTQRLKEMGPLRQMLPYASNMRVGLELFRHPVTASRVFLSRFKGVLDGE